MNPLLRNLLIVLFLILSAYAGGRYLQPARVEIQKEEVIKFKEIIKKDVIIVKKETKNVDGSVVTEETITDKSVNVSNTDKIVKESDITTNVKPQWKVSALAGYDFKGKDLVYGLDAQKRFLGPVSLGVWGTSKQQYGISIGMEF